MITVDLKWPSYLKDWLTWTNIFNLKIEISLFQPECSMPFGFQTKVKAVLMLPLAVLFIGLIMFTMGQDWCECTCLPLQEPATAVVVVDSPFHAGAKNDATRFFLRKSNRSRSSAVSPDSSAIISNWRPMVVNGKGSRRPTSNSTRYRSWQVWRTHNE